MCVGFTGRWRCGGSIAFQALTSAYQCLPVLTSAIQRRPVFELVRGLVVWETVVPPKAYASSTAEQTYSIHIISIYVDLIDLCKYISVYMHM